MKIRFCIGPYGAVEMRRLQPLGHQRNGLLEPGLGESGATVQRADFVRDATLTRGEIVQRRKQTVFGAFDDAAD